MSGTGLLFGRRAPRGEGKGKGVIISKEVKTSFTKKRVSHVANMKAPAFAREYLQDLNPLARRGREKKKDF